MIVRFIVALLLASPALPVFGQAAGFDRAAYYAAMESENLDLVNAQEKVLDARNFPLKDAFVGALMMKKASLIKGIGDKLSAFKSGSKLLEEQIKKNGDNPELRFLRLMIQENAPNILNYNDNIENDSNFVKKHFDQLDADTKKAVLDYSKQEKALKPSDF